MTAAEIYGHVHNNGELPFHYEPLPKLDSKTGKPIEVDPDRLAEVVQAAFWVSHGGVLPSAQDMMQVARRLHLPDDILFANAA